MISMLTGKIVHADTRFFVLDVHGVGYKVYSTAGALEKHAGETVTFWTHLAVREDAMDLYGFTSKEELEIFELLITVSGIGPKTALSILNLASISTIKTAVASGDPSYLTKVSGVGKKNAEKIVLELKDKLLVTTEDGQSHVHADTESDVLEALKSLGYPERDAREAVKKLPKDVTDTVERVKRALKLLGSK